MQLRTLIPATIGRPVTVCAMLLGLIVMGLPTAAHAVDATITVVGCGSVSVTGGDSLTFAGISLCGVDIDPSSQLTFQAGSGAQGLGLLTLSPFIVTNNSGAAATVQVNYGHTNSVVDATLVQCSGMSMDGWFTAADGVGAGDSVALSMTVTWVDCNQPNCNIPFQIGAQDSVPCPSVPGALATIPGSPPTIVHNAIDDLFYFPPATPQVFNLIPNACNSCSASARIDKTFTTTLGPGDSNNMVGTGLGFLVACGDPKAAAGSRRNPPRCTNSGVGGYVPVLLEAQIDWVVPHDTLTLGKQGMALSNVLTSLGVNCTALQYTVGGTPFLFGGTSYLTGVQGAPLVSVSFTDTNHDGTIDVCNLKHDVSLIPGPGSLPNTPAPLSCDTKFFVLVGKFTDGTDFKVGAPVTVSGNCP